MKIYLDSNVYESALERLRFVFDEFENVCVNFSGGKDSTIVLELALKIAKEKGRLPLDVFFLDQEIEWRCVIEYIRRVMDRPEINPIWLQVPFKMYNATSQLSPWLECWEEGVEWMREREPDAITENVYSENRYAKMYEAYTRYHYPDKPFARLGGVRCEESPSRMHGLTNYATYKQATWGKIEEISVTKSRRVGHYVFYPIYDWSYSDVWKAIHDESWDYCSLYDSQYQYGVPVVNMRVSNLHHETAVRSLFILQEIEPDTWEKATSRLKGVNTAGHMQKDFYRPKKLPFMFSTWKEYRDHLLENLILDTKMRDKMRADFARAENRYVDEILPALLQVQISAVVMGDFEGTKMSNFSSANGRFQKTGTHPLRGMKL